MRTGQVCVYFAKITKLLVNVLGSNVVPRDVGFVASHPCQCLELFTLTFLKMCASCVRSLPTSSLFLEPLTSGRVAASEFPSPHLWSHWWEADPSCTWGGKQAIAHPRSSHRQVRSAWFQLRKNLEQAEVWTRSLSSEFGSQVSSD